MKNIKKIVITGGPCGGKSTALSKIKENFEQLGWSVIVVPETATEIMSAGISPDRCQSVDEFQHSIFRLQIEKESIFTSAAKEFDNDKILIVCDRGIIDNKAYMTEEGFNSLIARMGYSEVLLRDSYDAVFHLVTAAKGAESFYTTANNAVRTETVREAYELDDKFIAAWTGHPHFRVIDNSTNFEDKIKRLNKEIAVFLGEPEPFEIERKFLIEYPDTAMLESLPNCTNVEIVQTYLVMKDGSEIRVRQRGSDGDYVYFKTMKTHITPTTRIEIEDRLTKDEYLTLLMEAESYTGQIKKTRYCLTSGNQYFEIDVYPFWNDKAVMEIELSDENQKIIFPPEITIIKEVTDDRNYSNHSLSVNHNI